MKFKATALTLALTLATGTQLEGQVTYSDTEFDPAQWDLHIQTFGGGGSASVQQVAIGGNPGAYRDVTQTVSNAVAGPESTGVFSYHIRRGFTYDPSQLGPFLGCVSFAVDLASINPIGGGAGFGLALRQGTNYFVGGYEGSLPIGPSWSTFSKSGLTPSDFEPILSALLDLSASAAPIEFGIVAANSNSYPPGTGGHTRRFGFDNFRVAATGLPCLFIALSNRTARVTWDTNVTDFALETTTNLFTTNAWSPVVGSPVITGGRFLFAEPADEAYRYYRLKSK